MTNSYTRISNDSIALVIFGVTGDLTKRKLIPAIYQLIKEKQIVTKLTIIGFARRNWDQQMLQDNLLNSIHQFSRSQPVDDSICEGMLNQCIYIQSTFEDIQGYEKLHEFLSENKYQGVIYYLATPPTEYQQIVDNLGSRNMHNAYGWTRIVVEKPYGNSLESTLELENSLHKYFQEDEIFRIDHYLGKETVQNILVFRFANGIFEPLWNNKYIDHIQITVAETIGVGTRAGYFDKAGIIRDMFANHLMQLLSLTAMEAPFAFNEGSVRDEKMKVLRSLRPMQGDIAITNSIRAQYGTIYEDSIIPGYLQEDGVAPDSITETYLAIKLFIDNWRWAGVPFYIRCGKRMPIQATEIVIHFKQIPLSLFNWQNMAGEAPNTLALRLQPDEGISLSFGAKVPGLENKIAPVRMEFCYQDAFGAEPPEAYERLLLDCILGDATLFTRSDEVIEQWKFTQNILDSWNSVDIRELPTYARSWGPPESDEFIQRDSRVWKNPA